LHKGGADNGVFIQITSDDLKKSDVPTRKYSIGILKEAQSIGDYLALAGRGRRIIRLHLTGDTVAGLQSLLDMIRN
jgi:hypothetical protein